MVTNIDPASSMKLLSSFKALLQHNGRALLLLLLLSFIFSCAFNVYAYDVMEKFGPGMGIVGFVSGWGMCFAFLVLMYSLHWVCLMLYLWGSSLFLFMITWFLRTSGLELNDEVVASVMETKPQEIFIYLNAVSIPLALATGAVCYVLARWIAGTYSVPRRERAALFALAAAAVVCLNIVWYRGLPYNVLLPAAMQEEVFSQASKFPMHSYKKVGTMIKDYYEITTRVLQELDGLKDPAELASTCGEAEPVTLLNHFGEALRADHLPFNGYERNTMPLLSRLPGIISFPKVASYATATRESTLGALSDATVEGRKLHYSGFMSLFNKHGFSTNAVLLPSGSVHDMPAYRLLKDTRNIVQIPEDEIYDVMNSLPYIFNILEQGRDQRLVLYVNNLGSHPAYYYREKNKVFLPDERNMVFPTMFPKQNIVNAYDNTILQNDEFIYSIIEKLKDRNAVYFYCSDHGQSLGERGNYTQNGSMDIPEQRYVACFVWFSDLFRKTHPDMVRNLEANAERLPMISHDYFFHTVIALGSISSQVVDPGLNLCSPCVRPFTGDVPAFPEYDRQLEEMRKRLSTKDEMPVAGK